MLCFLLNKYDIIISVCIDVGHCFIQILLGGFNWIQER